MKKHVNILGPALCLLASCASIQGPASVDSSATVASSYVFRGVPQTDNPALWVDMGASASDTNGGTYTGYVWGNMNLSSDSGDAIFPDGHDAKFTEVDFLVGYSRQVGDYDVGISVLNYSFPNVGGASTSEVIVGVHTTVAGLDAGFDLYIDVEEVDGMYANGSIGRSYEVGSNWTADLGLAVGYMDSDQGAFYIGDSSSGISDLVGSAALTYALNENTGVSLAVATSSVLAGDYEDALDAMSINSNNTWVTLGVSRSF